MTPERKTAEALLKETIELYNSRKEQFYRLVFSDYEIGMFAGIMKAYARQEVEKHLELAAEEVRKSALPYSATTAIASVTRIEITLT